MSTRTGGSYADALSRCLSIDLEVRRTDSRIYALAGVRPDTGPSTIFPAGRQSLKQALDRLDDLADGADFLLGHNLIEFDLPHLRAVAPRSASATVTCRGHAQTQSPGVPAQSLSSPGQALPGRAAETRARERSRTGRKAHSKIVLRSAEGPSRSAGRPAGCLALAHHDE